MGARMETGKGKRCHIVMCVQHWILFLLLVSGLGGCSAADTAARYEDGPLNPTEKAFLDIPDAQRALSNLKVLTSVPHVAGTKGDRQLAEFVRQQFVDAGIPQVSIDDLVVKLNYPDLERSSSLSLWEYTGEEDDTIEKSNYLRKPSDTTESLILEVEEQHLLRRSDNINNTNTQEKPKPKERRKRKRIFKASLSEDILDPDLDPTTDTIWRNHTFHGYSPAGNLSNVKFVYANYGRPQDFAVLQKAGISVSKKIVIMRYGQCFRGLKVRNAQNQGALGVILYSDPADDGCSLGQVYPIGPWRPPSGVQRGSVQFNSQCGGDPYRADPRYRELYNTSVEELCNVTDPSKELVPSIPSIPISYGDAIPLLKNLGGVPVADIPGADDFIGGLKNMTYRIGPSKGYLDMVVRNIDETTKVPNVVGIIPGSLPADLDQPVLLGNHRDAWVYGAADPNSGTSSLLEVAKGLGHLYKTQNWRPLRSIYLLSWSGEEYGLLGSTGWAELNMMVPKREGKESNSLLQRSLAYLNTDTVVSGDHLEVSASPALFSLWEGVISDLKEQDGTTLDDITTSTSRFLRNISMVDANSARQVVSADDDGSEIGVLGSGSDYTVFLDHFGIPSLDFSYSNSKAHYGQYHSIYDSFAWMDKFGGGDSPDSEGSSFELMAFAAKLWGLLALRLADSPIVPLDHVSQGRALTRYAEHVKAEIAKIDKTTFDFSMGDLFEAIDTYAKNAAQLQLYCSKTSAELAKSKSPLDSVSELKEQVEICNEKLGLTERFFLLEDGLPGRPWFQHCLQAPGLDLGYAAESFPGIQQALDEARYALAQDQIDKATERIAAAAENLSVEPL